MRAESHSVVHSGPESPEARPSFAARECRFSLSSTTWKAVRRSTSSPRCRRNRRSLRWTWRAISFWPVRVLLDEGTQNGELLRLVGEYFDALLSMDQSLPHQQNLKGLGLRILIIRAPSNRFVHLQ